MFNCIDAPKVLDRRADAVKSLAGLNPNDLKIVTSRRLTALHDYAKTDMHIRTHRRSSGYELAPLNFDVQNKFKPKYFSIDFERLSKFDDNDNQVEVS